MVISCDLCSVSTKQSSSSIIPPAQFIHLNKTHKISLLCEKCLSKTEHSVFYIPIESNQDDQMQTQNYDLNQGLNPNIYLQKMSENYRIKNKQEVRRQIQTIFERQVWQPFKQLEQAILGYKNVLGEYKKTVRAEYKAMMSKMDPCILESFKEIVIEMHQHSIDLEGQGKTTYVGGNRQTTGQKQELDTFVRAMKVSAQNEWNKIDVMIETAKRSYEKFRNVFRIEREQLEKKSVLLRKIVGKITIESQYSKVLNKQVEIKTSNGSQKGKQGKNGQVGVCEEIVEVEDLDEIMVISEDEDNKNGSGMGEANLNNVCDEQEGEKHIENEWQVIEQNHNVAKKPTQSYSLIELEQDSEQLQATINSGDPLETINVSNKQVTLNDQNAENAIQQSKRMPLLLDQPLSIKQPHFHQQSQLQSTPTVNPSAPNINQSIDLDDDCYIDSISKPIPNTSKSPKPNPKSTSINSKPLETQPKKTQSPPYLEYEIFQISVENYPNPFQALRNFLTTDFKARRQLQKNHIPLPSLFNPTSFHDYASHLKLIRKLKISYTRKKNLADLLKFLSECSNLHSLTICEPLMATEDIIQFIITSLPKLTRLQFLCYNKLNEDHIKLIPSHLPRLQEFYYGPKCHNNIALKSEYRQFREHKKEKRLCSVKNTVLIELMERTTSLTSLWISESNHMQKIFEFIEDKQNLKHLIVGKYVTDSSVVELSVECWNSMKKLINLHSLALLNVRIDATALEIVLKNNSQTLQTIEIYTCANWTDGLASLLKKCRFLKEFYLFNSDESIFKGQSLWDAVSLETLVLRSCQFMDFSAAQKKIGKLSQLRHIDVYGCEWFNDLILLELVKNKYITYLNLANTQIGSLFHDSLRYLFKIRCIALGSTRINAAAIEQLCVEFSQMQKLSLYNLCGSAVFNGRCMVKKNRLNKIGDILKSLKYLDIGSLNTADDSIFDHYKSIKTIYLWMSTNISRKKIQETYLKGVNVVDDA